jgi:hypothetical protein
MQSALHLLAWSSSLAQTITIDLVGEFVTLTHRNTSPIQQTCNKNLSPRLAFELVRLAIYLTKKSMVMMKDGINIMEHAHQLSDLHDAICRTMCSILLQNQ